MPPVVKRVVHGLFMAASVAWQQGAYATANVVVPQSSEPPPRSLNHLPAPPPAPGTLGTYTAPWTDEIIAIKGRQRVAEGQLKQAIEGTGDRAAVLTAMAALLAVRVEERAKINELRNAWRTHHFEGEKSEQDVRQQLGSAADAETRYVDSAAYRIEWLLHQAVERLRRD